LVPLRLVQGMESNPDQVDCFCIIAVGRSTPMDVPPPWKRNGSTVLA